MHVAVPVDNAAGGEGNNELPFAEIDKLKAAASGVADFPWEPHVCGSVRLLSRLRGLKSIVRVSLHWFLGVTVLCYAYTSV